MSITSLTLLYCLVDEEVRQQLTNHGVFRIVTGHQPHGNAPAVNKFSDDFEVIDCDSSYRYFFFFFTT